MPRSLVTRSAARIRSVMTPGTRASARARAAGAAALVAASATPAFAAGPAMPWDNALQAITDNLQGPTAHMLVLAAIVIAGGLWMFTRHEEGMKKIGQIAVGGAIALAAGTLVSSLGFTAGALM